MDDWLIELKTLEIDVEKHIFCYQMSPYKEQVKSTAVRSLRGSAHEPYKPLSASFREPSKTQRRICL